MGYDDGMPQNLVRHFLPRGTKMSHTQILQDFPYLTEDDIHACPAFAADRERKLETVTA
jgi:uncharacterized protein (DUF433 family)